MIYYLLLSKKSCKPPIRLSSSSMKKAKFSPLLLRYFINYLLPIIKFHEEGNVFSAAEETVSGL